jgi:MoaD family protein
MQMRVYATLRDLVGSSVIELDVTGPTDVRGVLQQAVAAHPQLAAKVWDADGSLSRSIQVLVNGRPIQYLAGLATQVKLDDDLKMFPPIGGGSA